MKKIKVIKKNSHFQKLYKSGKSIVSPYFICYVKEKKSEGVLFGITVSKKVGKAHLRNRAKRVLRVAVREAVKEGLCPCSMVLVARVKTTLTKSDKISRELISLLKKAGYFKESEKK